MFWKKRKLAEVVKVRGFSPHVATAGAVQAEAQMDFALRISR
jgi:hypothetical protein